MEQEHDLPDAIITWVDHGGGVAAGAGSVQVTGYGVGRVDGTPIPPPG